MKHGGVVYRHWQSHSFLYACDGKGGASKLLHSKSFTSHSFLLNLVHGGAICAPSMRLLKCQYVREKVPAAVFNYDKVWSQRHMLSKLLFIHQLWFTSNMTWTWHRTTIFRSRSNFKTSKSTVGMPKTQPPSPKSWTPQERGTKPEAICEYEAAKLYKSVMEAEEIPHASYYSHSHLNSPQKLQTWAELWAK